MAEASTSKTDKCLNFDTCFYSAIALGKADVVLLDNVRWKGAGGLRKRYRREGTESKGTRVCYTWWFRCVIVILVSS